MKRMHALLALLALAFGLILPMQVLAQSEAARIYDLEQRVARTEHRVQHEGAVGLVVFVCGAFCALWAQQTGRNAWLWFFLGVFFNFITLLVLLYKNSREQRTGR